MVVNGALNLLYIAATRATKALSVSMAIIKMVSLIKYRTNRKRSIPIVTLDKLQLHVINPKKLKFQLSKHY